MEKSEEELFEFLNEVGRIGRLRKRLISLLLCIEDVYGDLEANGEGSEEIVCLAKKIELLLGEFALSQQMADRVIAGMKPQERKMFIEGLPEILEIFGWQNKFDENGIIKKPHERGDFLGGTKG